MQLFDAIGKLDKKFALGTLLGFIGLGYAVYVDSIKQDKSDLVFEVLSNTSVFDLKEDIGKLDVIYGSESLKRQHKNLRIITLKISNEGNKDIVEGDYDSRESVGFKLSNGKIVERPELIETSSDYFKRNLILDLDTTRTVKINKVQFDQGEFFVLKVLTICDLDSVPGVSAFGKISGITKPFTVKTPNKNVEEKGFWDQLLEGSFWIHFARFWFYVLSFIAFVITIVLPTALIGESIQKSKRKKRIRKFKEKSEITLTPPIETVFEIYLTNGEGELRFIQSALTTPDRLQRLIRNALKSKRTQFEGEFQFPDPPIHQPHLDERSRLRERLRQTIRLLMKSNAIEEKQGEYTVNADFAKFLAEFLYFLKVQ